MHNESITAEAVATPIPIAVLEHELLLRELLETVLTPPEFELVLISASAPEFLNELQRVDLSARTGVALIELTLHRGSRLDDMSGLEVMRQMASRPTGFLPLILCGSSSVDAAMASFAAGARAVIRPEVDGVIRLKEAVRRVARGETLMSEQLPGGSGAATWKRAEALTPRELEVLTYIAGGADNLKIAAVLGISERTVKAHVHAIYRKLETPENRSQLTIVARQMGICPQLV